MHWFYPQSYIDIVTILQWNGEEWKHAHSGSSSSGNSKTNKENGKKIIRAQVKKSCFQSIHSYIHMHS
jgi:hypothetical protein